MGSMSKDEVNVFLFDEVKFLKATLVQMREAIEKLLPKVSCDSIACQSRCLCGAEKISEYGRKLLSQTQDIAAWHQASLLRAEAKGAAKSPSHLEGLSAETKVWRMAAILVDQNNIMSHKWLSKEMWDRSHKAAALRKQADGLEGK